MMLCESESHGPKTPMCFFALIGMAWGEANIYSHIALHSHSPSLFLKSYHIAQGLWEDSEECLCLVMGSLSYHPTPKK